MAGKLMRAVQYDSCGGGAAGLKHVEVPVPSPTKGEVLLKLEAISLNPVDWKIQEGPLRPIFPRKLPHIPATNVAGEVVEVGPGVKNFKAGDKVVAALSLRDGGGLAEYAVAKETSTVPRPPEVSADSAAALPVAGGTAYQALTEIAGLKLDGTSTSGPRKNILVTAASGGVGHYAVQLAKLGNSHVTATCGARNIDFVRSLGADEVLDYRTPEGAALTSPSGKKYDAVVHCTTGIPWPTFERNLSENGRVIDITPGPNAFGRFALQKITFSKKQLVPLLSFPKAEYIECLVKLLKEGKVKTVIDSKHPLSKAEEAWAKSIQGHATGKIIVEP
ncbi:chloroplast envelope quinone oxidoreductase homolog [Ipomoea triloba]|uniref:chloroplast envelope quinone oxidoreductase homolog n=1 Tax=Ipomoea triloba TaxID=35885 RepID=UPI00125E2B56|nr:chloroplast envelope quinone oxidoreductase homolog [Ipomoea triloba]XP_031100554.1 chloroplast envelope quinone oxidoreductase homolog [Ipomoea triloba]XP_031100555.1 chloroplast envelope quinone oxidoreductase homolog [Ipomoea triloba]